MIAWIITAKQTDNNTVNDDGITWFEQPCDEIESNSFEVFQVIGENAALVRGKEHDDWDLDIYTGAVYLLTNQEGKYYYDEEIVKVPEGKVAKQVGIFQYETKSEFRKTVPIIQIMNK